MLEISRDLFYGLARRYTDVIEKPMDWDQAWGDFKISGICGDFWRFMGFMGFPEISRDI